MIAEPLARVMRERQLTQEQVAREIGTRQPTVHRLLRGSDPSYSLYRRIVAAFPEIAEYVERVAVAP